MWHMAAIVREYRILVAIMSDYKDRWGWKGAIVKPPVHPIKQTGTVHKKNTDRDWQIFEKIIDTQLEFSKIE